MDEGQMSQRPMTTTVIEETPDAPEGATDRPMRADAQRNYDKLVAAARAVFASEGGSASMEAVAKEAGVGIGTLYRHFPKRVDIVEAVYREDVDELVQSAEKLNASDEPWAALTGWLRAFVRYARSKRTFLTELHEAFEENPQLRSESRERIIGAINIVLVPAQKAGEARTDIDGADLMQLLGSMCLSATLTPDQSERLLVMIEDGLLPPR
jgi:AcrR family transcriptional regulator